MAQADFLESLEALVQLDHDAVQAYDQAIERIDHIGIASQLTEFRQDHERHITDLSALIQRYGGTPPERSRDL